jgi:hypothetical protein
VDLSDLQPTHTRLPHASRQQLMGATFRVDPMGVVEDNFSGPTSTTGERLYDGDTAMGAANDLTAVIAPSNAVTQLGNAWSKEDTTEPEPAQQDGDGQSWGVTWQHAAMIGAAAIAVAVVTIVFGQLRSPPPTPVPPQSPPPVTVTAQPPVTVTAEPAWTSTTPVPPPSTTPVLDPETVAFQQLQQYADKDPRYTAYVAAGQWVPQLSSKHGAQPWTYDKEDGVTYDSELTLQEHQRLRHQYGAKLIWSGDWVTPAGNTVWDHPDYWITVAPIVFPDSGGALKWCTSRGLDSDHCDAQNLITGHAAYNN